MTSRDKLIERIKAGNRTIELSDVDAFLVNEGFLVKRTSHTFLYRKEGYRITFNAHNKVLHPRAVKDLRELLIDLGIIS